MAELILNSNGPHKGSEGKSYYDFDPGNGAMLEAIEAYYAKRSGTPEMQEEYLAELCAKSLDRGGTVLRSISFLGWLKSLRKLYRRARSGTGIWINLENNVFFQYRKRFRSRTGKDNRCIFLLKS